FTCKLPASTQTQNLEAFSIKITDKKVAGFQVGFQDQGTADSYEVLRTDSYPFLCSLGSRFGAPLELPEVNGVKTYIVQGIYDKVFIAPILDSGKKCFKE